MKIHIEWLSDDHYCETCGTSFATGARVFADGTVFLDLEPVAHCFDGKNWTEEDVYREILRKLGHEVEDLRDTIIDVPETPRF